MTTALEPIEARPTDESTATAPRGAPPRRLERSFAMAVLGFLTVSLPTSWFSLPSTREEAVTATGGPILTATFFVLSASLIPFMVGRWRRLVTMVRSEPLLPAFMLLALASTVWSADPSTTLRRSISLLLAAFVGYYLATRYDVRSMLRLVSTVFSVTLLLNLAWVVAIPRLGVAPDGGWTGVLNNRNPFGRMMTLHLLIFVLAAGANRRGRYINILLAVASFGAVVGSQSKTSLIAATLLLAMLLVFRTFRARHSLFGAVILAEAGGAMVGLLAASAQLGRITDFFDRDITLSGRTELWALLGEEILHRPMLGWGWNAYWGGWFSPNHEIWVSAPWLPPSSHNALLEYTLELGIVGTGIFLALVVRAIGRSTHFLRRTPRGGMFPLGMLTLTVLFSMTETGLARRGVDWTLFVAAVGYAATDRIARSRSARSSASLSEATGEGSNLGREGLRSRS